MITNTAAATLQQLVVSVFDQVVAEDRTLFSYSSETGESDILQETRNMFLLMVKLSLQADQSLCGLQP